MTKHALKQLPGDGFEAVATRFRALGEVNRLKIVEALQTGEQSVGRLVSLTGLSQPNVSRHLMILVAAGLVGRRKSGLQVFYRVVDEHLSELCEIVCKSVSRGSKKHR